MKGLIFVVDSTDRKRLSDARAELEKSLSSKKLRKKPLLVLANKQDVDGAMSIEEVRDGLHLQTACVKQEWNIFASTISAGAGLKEAADWMASAIAHRHSKKSDGRQSS